MKKGKFITCIGAATLCLVVTSHRFFYSHHYSAGVKPVEYPQQISSIPNENSQISRKESETLHHVSNPPKYVSLCASRRGTEHRLGNHLFMLAAMLHLATLTGRVVVVPKKGWVIDTVFDVSPIINRAGKIEKSLCPCKTLNTPHYNYDARFDNANFISALASMNKTILVCGLSQTFLHAEKVSSLLRQLLTVKYRLSDLDRTFLYGNQTDPANRANFGLVGVHVRGGDFLNAASVRWGLTVVDSHYLQSAFRHFSQGNRTVRFIVTTDDWKFTEKVLSSAAEGYDIVRSVHRTGPEDFALLTACDAVVMSTGSYGWWASWFVNTTTVYYKNWPRKNSRMDSLSNVARYFPPYWIPML